MSLSERVLCVAAHPDDEIGCAGTLAKHVQSGDAVMVVFLSEGTASRGLPGTDIVRRRECINALQVLGIKQNAFGNFPDNQFDAVPLLAIVRDVEDAVQRFKPSIVYTHWRGDLNIDHQRTHEAVRVACRPQPGCTVKKLLYFEVPCSTTWGSVGGDAFAPDCFVDINYQIGAKLDAAACYVSEMREGPHPRSLATLTDLAHFRGSAVGVTYAEGFKVGRIVC